MRVVDVNGIKYEMSDEDADKVQALIEKSAYLDKRQYNLKIKLNSLYGALSNPHFRHFDPRLGNSTTGTGRLVLEHIAKSIGKYFDGEYTYPNRSCVYGDTDSGYFLTHGTSVADAVAKSNAFAKELNDTMPEFMARTFMCTGNYTKQIQVARELVADRGIFVDKKMYMLHVVDKKGKSSDEMKVMGLMLKKTSIPKEISASILALFEGYMKQTLSWDDFTLDVIALRKSLADSSDIKLIGKPITVKNVGRIPDVREALAAGRATGTMVPGHVRAALLYNYGLKQHGDTENHPIASSTKVRTYPLKMPQHGCTSIALPTDVDPIPQWFIDTYWPMVDIKAQLARLVDAPIQQVLTAINKTVPTENDLVANECLEF